MTEQELREKIIKKLNIIQDYGYVCRIDGTSGTCHNVSNESVADALIAAGLTFDKTKAILAERANSKMLIQKAQYYDQMKHRAEVWKQATKDMINTDICFGCHARATGICSVQNPNPETDKCLNAIYKQAEKELQEEKKDE